jgi:putative oxidoreductase
MTASAAHHPHLPTHHAQHHDPAAAAHALAEEEAELFATEQKRVLHMKELCVAGRLLLSAAFILSGIIKVMQFAPTRDALMDAGVSGPNLLLAVAVVLELVCGTMLAVGFKVRAAAITLTAYLAVLTVLVRADLANLALAGGLLMLAGNGAGLWSFDEKLERKFQA